MSVQWRWITMGETMAGYGIDDGTRQVGLTLVPKTLSAKIVSRREPIDAMVQVALRGDAAAKGFLNGSSMHNSETAMRMHYVDQQITNTDTFKRVVTTLTDGRGLFAEHTLTAYNDQAALTIQITLHNKGTVPLVIEHLDSFSLSRLSPLTAANPPGNLTLTRFRSKWAQEARPDTRAIEALGLEPSWKPSGASVVQYGQIGSMPVRGFFPYIGIHDRDNNVSWAAQLEVPTSWQMSAFRKDDGLVISGGLADRDDGHWSYSLAPGTDFAAPSARVICGCGAVAVVGQGLAKLTQRTLTSRNSGDARQLPIVYNEFCNSWGQPTAKALSASIPLLAVHGISDVVIDAGWYADEAGQWEANMGDWQLNHNQFPEGLAAISSQIRAAHMVPGLWFEPETVGLKAKAVRQLAHLLHRDGRVITAGSRRFWDMTDPWVQDYLRRRVIDCLRANHFGYVKIDYNDNIGIGCDGAESLGEGLRRQGEATQAFIRKLRAAVPNIVIENCASGGHRLEPSMMALTDVSSFSDAHEAVCIPLIAGHLHALMLPQQELIWAVLHHEDTNQRLVYSLAATFLGRMCLSGDVTTLSATQWQVVDDAIAFYRAIGNVIREGITERYGQQPLSYQHPTGAQVIVRSTPDTQVLVYHRFGGEDPRLTIPVNWQKWQIHKTFGLSGQQQPNGLVFATADSWQAGAVMLTRADGLSHIQ